MYISLLGQFIVWLLDKFDKRKTLSFGEKYHFMIKRLDLELLLKNKGFVFE